MRQILLLLMFITSTVFAEEKVKTFAELTAGTEHLPGFFSLYLDNGQGKAYVAVTAFEQPFLFQSSLPFGVGSNDLGLDRGQLGETRMVQFERVGNKVLLRQLNTYYRANSDNQLEQQAVTEAFASSILWGFTVAAEQNGAVLIDYTPFLLSDIHHLGEKLAAKKEGSYQIDESRSALYAKRSKSFVDNTELEAIVTFKGQPKGQYLPTVVPEAQAVSVHMHHSLIRLPDNQYQPREFHPYSGYWSIDHADYAAAIDQPLVKRVIPRHRLAKKHQNQSISEPIEPIVYYLDPGVPEPVKSALIDGALWWNDAFTKIGYKNAFQVKMLPDDADPMDVRYNVIQWVHRATRGWSYGSSVIDPRTGEIIKGHVTLGSLRVRQDYLIALGLTSPFTSDQVDTSAMKAMALARIRQLSAHEVGHTLGIAHNFAASSNDRASVMDYPHPFIQLSSQGVDLSNAYSEGVGTWDDYTIAYGYSDIAASEEAEVLQRLVISAQQQGLGFISDPDARAKSGGHASAHLWDNGANAIDELARVMNIRQQALTNFGLNSVPMNTPLSEIETTLVPIYNFHRYQVEAVAKLIAGIDYSYEVKTGAKANGVRQVSPKVQQQAINRLLETLSPEFLTLSEDIVRLIPPKAYGYARDRESFISRTGITFDPVSAAEASAKHTLEFLLHPERLARLAQHQAVQPSTPSVGDLLAQLLAQTIYQPPQSKLAFLVQQRTNQQVIDQLTTLWLNKQTVSEIRADIFVTLRKLRAWLTQQPESSINYAQHQLFIAQIDHVLARGQWLTPVGEVSMPPGSPIGG